MTRLEPFQLTKIGCRDNRLHATHLKKRRQCLEDTGHKERAQ